MLRDPGKRCLRSCSEPTPELRRQAGTHLGFKPPSPSPVLASPSVNMMRMEVLLSGTRFLSRASFSIWMPLSSPSLILVTVYRQKDRTIGWGVLRVPVHKAVEKKKIGTVPMRMPLYQGLCQPVHRSTQ